MRRAPLALLVAALAAAWPAAASAAERPTIGAALAELRDSGRISEAEHRERARTYRRVRSALRRLDGAPREALADALEQVAELAGDRRLPGRLAPTFLTLERNLQWYWDERRAVPPSGARQRFGTSEVIFQHYSHAGWQVQPLASYGRLNGLLTGRRPRVERARRLAEDLLALAVRRAGRLAPEYHFSWSGGGPGWVSGMASATAVQALARLARATGEQRFADAAAAMLFVFERRPPVGVRAERRGAGPHFLLYSQSPRLLVGNGFAQALVGLHDYAAITGDPRGARLYEEGLARARATIGRFDTGAWSLYWRRPGTRRGQESSLHYHRVFRTFLARLCERGAGEPFCRLDRRFAAYEAAPIRIGRLRTSTRGTRVAVRVWTSKRGSGTLAFARRGRLVASRALRLERGTRVVRLRLAPGAYRVRISARSETGIESARAASLRVRR